MMQQSRTRPTILIVEDYADSRQMLKLLLEELDYFVLTAASGKEALAVAADNHIDVILIDYGLPDMTGPTVIRSLRQRHQLKDVPIVMLTAFDGTHYRRLANEAGCDAYLVKPPDFDDLKDTVDQLLQERTKRQDRGAFRVQHIENDFRSLPQAVRT
jgi:CheY-like chemotaxis protein